MTAQDALYIVLMGVVFLVAWAMLTGGTGDSGPALVHGRHRAGRPGLAVVPGLEPDDVLPFVSGPDYRDEPDDWTADLPTAVIPLRRRGHHADLLVLDEPSPGVDRPRRTSPSWAAADDWPPIFTQLADQWGYDHERGFDGLVAAA
jgi:hypothetical protein